MGVEILAKAQDFPPAALNGVLQHHERCDGSGYPRKLVKDTISLHGRILAITDVYDNHCNHPDPLSSFTPYQALSFMFTQQKVEFDAELLALRITSYNVCYTKLLRISFSDDR